MLRRAVALVATVAASLAGCGRGKHADDRAGVVQRADAVCARSHAEEQRLARQLRTAKLADLTEQQLERVAALNPPPAHHKAVEARIRLLRAEAQALEQGNFARAVRLIRALDAQHPGAIARRYGFKVCGSV